MKLNYFTPVNYDIVFSPDLELFRYGGKEIITFRTEEESRDFVLDCVGLEIVSCKLLNDKHINNVNFEVKDNRLDFHFLKNLKKGEHKLEIEFKGEINNFLAGWYRSRYEKDGKIKYFATTHFEPADARRVFPCVDHPAYKATFDIAMEIDKDLTAVSNMLPLKEKSIVKNKKIISFGRSPLMSTYLLYMGVGEFEYLESKYKDVVIRGVTTPGKSEYTKFALDCTKKFLSYFEEFFGFTYPLPKVDLIAVPDFAAGAMEQWGAITFRENGLLYIPGRTSVVSQQYIAEVIAHELAHQWFGNLVTMKWWDDLWLNESFATFMAFKAVHHFWPEWNIWNNYLSDTIFRGMELDSLQSSHPIQVSVADVAQINELFDEIAYDKGGSILRMLEEYLNNDVFRNGLREYIVKFQYGNAEGSDLWRTLEKVSRKPVAKMMESFIKQTGFPSVFVNLREATLSVRQERFSFDKDKKPGKWFVPLVVQDDHGITRHLLEDEGHNFLLPHTPEFVNINYKYCGFYISVYSQESFKMLGKYLDHLYETDRVGVIHDLYYSVLATTRTVVDFIEFIKRFFEKEKNPTVLVYILRRLFSIYLYLRSETLNGVMIEFAEHSLGLVNIQPQKGENPENVVLRNLALYVLSLFDHKETFIFVKEQFKAFLGDEASLHQDLRATIYGLAVRGSDQNYEIALDLYRKTTIKEERVKFLSALAVTKNKKLLKRTLDFSLSDEVSFSDIVYIFASASRNPQAIDLVGDWLMENWDTLVKNGGGIADMLLRHILKLVVPVSGVGREDKLKKFLFGVKNVKLEKTFEQVIEEMEVYSRFVRFNRKLIR